jgi:hypothetical protein
MTVENKLSSYLCTELIDEISQVFEHYQFDVAIQVAQKNWPQYRFIGCSEYDMGEKEPFKALNGFSFFLIAASLGCATLTIEPSQSVGLIVAQHEDD